MLNNFYTKLRTKHKMTLSDGYVDHVTDANGGACGYYSNIHFHVYLARIKGIATHQNNSSA